MRITLGVMTYTLQIDRYAPSDPRLGRHVLHDSRSRAYAAPEGGQAAWKSIRHHHFIPVMDQGNLGSCTGNAAVGCLGAGQFWDTTTQAVLSATDASHDEAEAVTLYSAATRVDAIAGAYPPDDTGSTGLAVAKACKNAGLITGYTHAFSFDALLTALSSQPTIVGTEWTRSMFTPDADGRLHPTGPVEGGHEYLLDELDVEGRRVWLTNSWGEAWGRSGRAWFSFEDLQGLLARNGDCTIFTPSGTPAPTPTADDELRALLASASSQAKQIAAAIDQALTAMA